MSFLLDLIRNIDIGIYHFLNGFAGSRILDHFASFEEDDSLLKGGLFLAIYWYLWFRAGSDQDRRRRAIIAILAGALLALVASRIIANFAPYRIRPMYDLHLQHRLYSFPTSPHLVNWSAFPSDTAAFFFALAFGLAYLSRRLAIPAMLYVVVWVCLPRMFLGVHFASDIVAGAVIGIVVVWASLKVGWLHSGFATRLLAFAEARPEVFYAAAFLASFEMGVLFDDIRGAAATVFHIAHVEYGEFIHAGLTALATLGFLAIAAYLVFLARRASESQRRQGAALGRTVEEAIKKAGGQVKHP
jgi:membrane-associated phospholipid phosphatase